MSAQTKNAARELRRHIIRVLGAKCARCSATEELTLDCVTPKGPHAHRGGYVGRQWFYWKEHRLGNIQILCRTCNIRKGVKSQREWLLMLQKK